MKIPTIIIVLSGIISGTAHAWNSDPNTLTHVACHATTNKSDLTVDIVRTGDGLFSINVSQTLPVVIRAAFPHANAGWSGHFFNFQAEAIQASAFPFHLLTRGMVGGNKVDLDNLQVQNIDGSKYEITTPFECSLK